MYYVCINVCTNATVAPSPMKCHLSSSALLTHPSQTPPCRYPWGDPGGDLNQIEAKPLLAPPAARQPAKKEGVPAAALRPKSVHPCHRCSRGTMMVARKAPRTPNAVVSSTPVPAMAILQVFRELAGERGRQAHRPCAQPTRPNTRTASRRT